MRDFRGRQLSSRSSSFSFSDVQHHLGFANVLIFFPESKPHRFNSVHRNMQLRCKLCNTLGNIIQGCCLTVARSPGAPSFASAGDQISERVARTSPKVSQGDSSSLSRKFDPTWRLNDEKSDMFGENSS